MEILVTSQPTVHPSTGLAIFLSPFFSGIVFCDLATLCEEEFIYLDTVS